MTSSQVSRWSRRFVAVGALFFVTWALADLLGSGRRLAVSLALYGFVLHTVFGKSYALIPSYFDRSLAVPRAPAVQFPLTTFGAGGLAAGSLAGAPPVVAQTAAVAWFAGVLVWIAALGWTIRGNLTGAETGTGDHQARRRSVDRIANAAVPLVGCYLLVGSYELAASAVGLPTLLDGWVPRVSHLLGAGGGALLIFAVGFRLFPRFMVVSSPRAVVAVVLSTGALGPALLAAGLSGGPLLTIGAAVEGVALGGFALAYGHMYVRSGRQRVGIDVAAVAVVAAVVALVLALYLAVVARPASLVSVHYRFALVGFLGLTIVGATYQFYPPTVGAWPGSTNRTARTVAGCVAGGLALQIVGLAIPGASTVGAVAVLVGALSHAYLLASAFVARS